MARWLKNIKDGEIYEWDEILAENPLTKEVTEEEAEEYAYERFDGGM